MQYTIMIHETGESFAARTDPTLQAAYWGGTLQYLQSLKDAGIFVGGAGLQPPHTATLLHYDADGAPVVQDGPMAETKESIGGYFIVDLPDLDRALEWAARFPRRVGTSVEVRPNLPND
jgi:hypothetical protein